MPDNSALSPHELPIFISKQKETEETKGLMRWAFAFNFRCIIKGFVDGKLEHPSFSSLPSVQKPLLPSIRS